MSLRWSGASERGDLGALCAVNSDGSPGAWLIEQGGVKARAQVTSLDVEDGLERDLQKRGNIVRMLAAMQQIENTGASLNPGSCHAAFDDGCQRAQFVLW